MQPPIQNSNSSSERVWNWLEKALRDRKNPGSAFEKISRGFSNGLATTTIVYFLSLMALLFLLGWWGERHWFLSILLFVPPVIWLVPLLLLTPFHVLIRPKLCWITLAALLVLLFIYLDFNWTFSNGKSKAGLTLLTNNVGGRKFHTLAGFIEKENPDIIALQDTARIGSLTRQYPERFVANVAEFVLVSKFPIRKSGLLTNLTHRGDSIGAWHELQYEDQSIVVYNIHMPTPRPEFVKLHGRGLIVEMIGGKGIYSSEVRKAYREFVQRRLELARGLVEVLQNEKRPFLVAGDFNMPANGYIFDQFDSNFVDAFGTKGRGYGFTFPGKTGGLLNLFGSWLRLDYLFAGKNWETHSCGVELRGTAEHQAVIARFELKPTAHKP